MWRLGHRPALDGLRAIAVLAVVAAHLEVPWLSGGGMTGVTLFFVLSGFLITSLLAEELQRSDRISFRGFYERRARRLLPAVLVVIVAWSVWDAFDANHIPVFHDAGVGLFYVANFARASGQGMGSLGHLWSLAVEEQFYLLWPPVLLLLWRRPRLLVGLLTVAAVAVMWHRTALWHAGVPEYRVQFATDTRADGILLGCALGIAMTAGWRLHVPRWLCLAAALAFVGCSTISSFAAEYDWAFTLAALASVVVLAGLVTNVQWRWLEHPALGWIGKRSYGLYLWHIPINLAVQNHVDTSWQVRDIIVVPVTLLVVMLSYRFVEQPFTARRVRGSVPTPATSTSLSPGLSLSLSRCS